MINSNYNLLISNSLKSDATIKEEVNSFLNNLVDKRVENKTSKTNSLTYENIKGISLEEIETLFVSEDEKNMAKNLRLTTLFSNDEILGKALFNTVLGQPFELGYSYLSDRYNDKSIFLSSKNRNNLFDLLQESISQKINNLTSTSTDVISQDKLDEILTKVDSFNFISALSNSSKKGYDKYKNEKNDYSFLYNDYNLKYQELMYKYKELENFNKNIIKQF
ncbi:hypothetical protein [Arcobacter aquimarinus]|uniref:Uncharacterized protein n=1 Tax=Arcobacter aquimarinus TaxID=1315211 RepID=A0AAE7B5N1_9BACT|nr:hypothetical protein [Arcobacter aquimarinus]QKE26239.1 hypothetical protein AAQM_1492 [Arcobacter aquimarinus]RXI35763.1 hypothetical protein CP986_05120 [Arcobacter aquimarinus]